MHCASVTKHASPAALSTTPSSNQRTTSTESGPRTAHQSDPPTRSSCAAARKQTLMFGCHARSGTSPPQIGRSLRSRCGGVEAISTAIDSRSRAEAVPASPGIAALRRSAPNSFPRVVSFANVSTSVHAGHENGPRTEVRGPFPLGSGDRIRTCDLWVMSPASYRAAPPRVANTRLPGSYAQLQIGCSERFPARKRPEISARDAPPDRTGTPLPGRAARPARRASAGSPRRTPARPAPGPRRERSWRSDRRWTIATAPR